MTVKFNTTFDEFLVELFKDQSISKENFTRKKSLVRAYCVEKHTISVSDEYHRVELLLNSMTIYDQNDVVRAKQLNLPEQWRVELINLQKLVAEDLIRERYELEVVNGYWKAVRQFDKEPPKPKWLP